MRQQYYRQKLTAALADLTGIKRDLTLERSADELEFYADSTPGDSGGPVFGFWSGLPYAVGTVSGGEKTTFLWWTIEDDNAAAGGNAMVDLIRWARTNWP